MKSIDMLDVIGEAKDVYVLAAGERPKLKKHRPFSKFLLIAAIIGLLTATAAAASEVLRIWVKHNDSFTSVETSGVSPRDESVSSEIDMSKAGVIEFRMNIDEEISGEPMPVLEVVPYFLTEEDVKRVAYALFPDGEFYEGEPMLDPVYSMEEIQEKIDRWTQYSTEEALLQLYPFRPDQTNYQSDIAKLVNSFIEEYSDMLPNAPDESPYPPCEWKYKKASYYRVSESRIASRNIENDNDAIEASVEIGDVRYRFTVAKRDRDDFLISNIHAYPEGGLSPDGIDDKIFKVWLCGTAEPTEAQITAVKQKAEEMLRQMDLGSWMVDECSVETEEINEYTYYSIHVNAVPVLNGVPALRKFQLQNLRSEEDGAARYYYTDVAFEFSANGDLVSFDMWSPIEIKNTDVTEITSSVKIEKQIEKAKEYLSQIDFYTYSQGLLYGMEEPIGCIVEITDLEYNLTRINGNDPLESYYYVPGIKLVGTVHYYDLESGETYLYRENIIFVVMSGEDGTILMNS